MSVRADVITRRTYNRPLNPEGTKFETWAETVDRVIKHQRWLWERALTHQQMPYENLHDLNELESEWKRLNPEQDKELEDLRTLMIERKVSVAGRGLWLGGTWVAQAREICQFNCSFIEVRSIYDMVDVFWALLNGSGVGFRPISGQLTGFRNYIPELQIIPSTRTDKGRENNIEKWDATTSTWTISIGDSAEAWAKSIGKILAGKYPAQRLVLDLSEIRPAGTRLRNYGWISQGDKGLSAAYEKIFSILNSKADSLLSTIDILDITNLLGTVLSTRRSAQISVLDYGHPDWEEFASAKNSMWELGLGHRSQSNNSLVFWSKPTQDQLEDIVSMIFRGGNGEPGIINGEAMKQRAPWAIGLNPCAEILLGDGGVCNLTTIDLAKFKNDTLGLHKAAKLIARANYRQTCVDLRDGILQEKWHLNNDFTRLCGVSLMGVAAREDLKGYDYRRLERTVSSAAYSMAKELGTPYPKNVTTVKPEGTISKCFDSTEGMHKPLGKYIFNNVAFNIHDPLVPTLREAGYKVFDHPYDRSAYLVTLPVKYESVKFDVSNGVEVNLDSAVEQLNRYKMLMQHWCHQNVSCTISYDPDELWDIVDWLYHNWDNYVAVSFLLKNDPTKTAQDLGYPYLPQEVVSKETYESYVKTLRPVVMDNNSGDDTYMDDGCANGVCPVR